MIERLLILYEKHKLGPWNTTKGCQIQSFPQPNLFERTSIKKEPERQTVLLHFSSTKILDFFLSKTWCSAVEDSDQRTSKVVEE